MIDNDYTSVWIIEATGKIACLTKTLVSNGYHPKVIATRGHFCKLPESLGVKCIDNNFKEYDRTPDIEIVKRMREAIEGIVGDEKSVYIATDDDMEGAVIAWDVYENIRDICNPLRVKLNALDSQSLKDALSKAGEIKRDDAIPGRTRAIIDRLIGTGFAEENMASGRVGSAILGIVAKTKPSIHKLCLVAPSIDHGRPWRAECMLNSVLSHEIAGKLVGLSLPALTPAGSKRESRLPNDMGRILVKAGDDMDLSPLEASKAMQSAYESGSLSYPRAGSRGMGASAASSISALLRKQHYNFDKSIVPPRPENEPHDAPYPIGHVDVSYDPLRMGHTEGIRTLIARDLIATGEKRRIEYHQKGVLYDYLIANGYSIDVAKAVDDMPWERDFGQPVPGESNRKESEIVARRADTVLLEKCVEHDIGRPSTWPAHIEKFMEKGILDSELQLTELGVEMIARTPEILLNPAFSKAIIKACENGRVTDVGVGKEPWQALASKIVSAIPKEISSRMMSATREEGVSREQVNDVLRAIGIEKN